MSEPDAGSAVTDLKTSAKPDGKSYIVNGTKVFSTFSPEAVVFLVYVRYGPGVGGIGSVLVERGTPGFTIGPPQEFMSGEQWSELHFENCRIPAENVLLGPGGFKKQMASFNVERLGNTARSLAFGRYCYERAREHAGVRQQFGRPLAEFQGLQWKFADMAIKLEGAQLLLYRAAANADKGLPSAYETAVAKAACNQTGFEVANESMQIMGATGYSKTSLVEYCMRRCRGWMIAGGSVEMLKNRIAEHVFDRKFDQRPPKPEDLRGGEVTKPLAQVLLAPQSVAIIGQSNDATKTAGRPLKYLRQAGYAGRVYPINPRRDEVLGERAWPSLAALPEIPEHAYIVARPTRRWRRSRSAPDRSAGRDRARQRLFRDRRGRRGARGADRAASEDSGTRSSGRRASAWSTCGTRRFSPPMPRSTSRTCRSAASSRRRIPAA